MANNFIFILIASCILRSLNEGHFINVNLTDWYIYIHENVAGTKQVSVSWHSNFVNNNQEKEGLMAHPYNLIISMLYTNPDNARTYLLCQAWISNDFPNLQLTFRSCCVGFGTYFSSTICCRNINVHQHANTEGTNYECKQKMDKFTLLNHGMDGRYSCFKQKQNEKRNLGSSPIA